MIIGVNTRLLLPHQLEGIGWFAAATLERITKAHPEHEFHFYFDRKFDESFIFNSNVKPYVVYPPARHPYLWTLFFEYGIPYALNRSKADIFLSPDGWVSLKTKVPTVDVIHDLNFEHHADFFTNRQILKYYQTHFRKFAHKATRLVTVSEFSKRDIIETYQIAPDKIDVAYNGCNNCFKPLSESEKKKICHLYAKGCSYFLFVGSIHKRKNLAGLFKAFDKFKERTDSSVKLIVVGSKKWWKGEIEDAYQTMLYKDEVIFTGHVDNSQLGQLTAASLALTYVSFFEGFGIPILEAFHAETAVITSKTTSMPEVAGNAALYIDPYSTESMAEAMQMIYKDTVLREQLIQKGRLRRIRFNWDKTAALLWQAVEKIM